MARASQLSLPPYWFHRPSGPWNCAHLWFSTASPRHLIPWLCSVATHSRKSSTDPYLLFKSYKSPGMYPSSDTECVGGGNQMTVNPHSARRGASSVTRRYQGPGLCRADSQLNPWIKISRPSPVGICVFSPGGVAAGGATGVTAGAGGVTGGVARTSEDFLTSGRGGAPVVKTASVGTAGSDREGSVRIVAGSVNHSGGDGAAAAAEAASILAARSAAAAASAAMRSASSAAARRSSASFIAFSAAAASAATRSALALAI